jgi:hypothetical protein
MSQQNNFIIYLNDYAQDLNPSQAIIEFTTLMNFDYNNQNKVAYEPLEYSSFSTDSKQDTPFEIKVTATKCPIIKTPSDLGITQQLIQETIDKIEQYNKAPTLVCVFNKFKLYSNIIITKFHYDINPQKTILYADIAMQEIRLFDTQYQALPRRKVRNKQHASTVDTGTQQAQNVNSDLLNRSNS